MFQRQAQDQSASTNSEQLSNRPSAESKGVMLAAAFMIVLGWGGLAHLVTETRPRIGGEIWLFFILLQIAITGTAIPIMRFLSLRFLSVNHQAAPLGVVVRRSVWAGILVVVCAWLLIPRALSWLFVLILALIFLMIEVVLRNRDLAHER